MQAFLSTNDFAREVRKLEPRWAAHWNLPHYLEAFDEAGCLRPIFRVLMPVTYARYRAQPFADPKELGLDDEKIKLFATVSQVLFDFQATADRFEPEMPWPDPPDVLRPYIRAASAAEDVDWSRWKVEVTKDQRGRSVMERHVLAFYGDWQRLRLWVLLEAYTYTGLLDPRRLQPSDVFKPSWDNNLSAKVAAWTTGNGRMLPLLEQIEEEGWIADLYRARRIFHWGSLLYAAPEMLPWHEGKALDQRARWEKTTAKIRAALEATCARWRDRQAEFEVNVGRLIELWEWATKRHATPLAVAIEDDLRAAAMWEGVLSGGTPDDLSSRVARKFPNLPTLNHVLWPSWRRARDVAECRLPQFARAFNETMAPVPLITDDIRAFLDFLDEHQLGVWHLELAEILEQTPSDTILDRRFVHLRSLALLVQPVIAALADAAGTPEDKSKVRGRGTKGPMSVFLVTRNDWRRQLWGCIDVNWCLTITDRGTPLEDRLEAIASLSLAAEYEGCAKTLLALGALRSFGAHRFSNDPQLLSRYWPQLVNAVVFTPLFYWKVATELG